MQATIVIVDSREDPSVPRRLAVAGAVALVVALGLLVPVAVWQDREGLRVLGDLKPVFDAVIGVGRWASVTAQQHWLACGVAAFACCFALAAVAWRRHRLSALVLAATGAALLAEALVVGRFFAGGVAVFVVALMAALAAGALSEGDGWTEFRESKASKGRREPLMIGALTGVAVVLALYGLNQHPQYFFSEKISVFLQTASDGGLIRYLTQGGFTGNSNGMVDLLVLWVLTRVLGCTLLAVRLTPVLASVATVPLFYLFVRKLGGPAAAFVATVLLMSSPTHIWFARSDYGHFAFVGLFAVLLGWLSLRAVERGGAGTWIAVAGLMAASRFVYAAGQVAWLIPVALLLHTAVVRRGRSRGWWYGWVAVAAGSALWMLSVSVVVGALRGLYTWIPPVSTYGAAAWNRAGADSGLMTRLTTVFAEVSNNLGDLLAGLFSDTLFGEQFWYRWSLESNHEVWAVSAAAALMVPAVGMLIGRCRDTRSALLLIWVGVAVIPGCLSSGMGVRRVLLMFPAVYAAVGLFVAVVWFHVRGSLPRCIRLPALLLLCGMVAGIFVVGVNAGLRAVMKTPRLVDHGRMVGGLLDRNEIVVHDFDPRGEATVAFFNLHKLDQGDGSPVLQAARPGDWPKIAFKPRFLGDAEYYRFTGRENEARRRAGTINPGRVAFVVHGSAGSQSRLGLLRGLYPEGEWSECCGPSGNGRLHAVEIRREEMDEVRRLECRARDPGKAKEILAQALPLVAVDVVEDPGSRRPYLRGGLVAPATGWYAFTWRSACLAELQIGGAAVRPDEVLPLIEGIHSVDLVLHPGPACEEGLDLRWRRFRGVERSVVRAAALVGPRLAELSQTRPEPMKTFDGYAVHEVVTGPLPGVWDMAADSVGGVAILITQRDSWSIRRLDPEGAELESWRLQVPLQPHGMRIASAPDGTLAVLGSETLAFFGPQGEERVSEVEIPSGHLTDIAFDATGRLWTTSFHQRALIALAKKADGASTFSLGRAGANVGLRPLSLDIEPSGLMVVGYETGLVQVMEVAWEAGILVLQREFRIETGDWSGEIRLAVEPSGWIHVAARPPSSWWSYDADGGRRLAELPQRSLFGSNIRGAWVIAAAGESLWIHDEQTQRLWKVQR